MVLSSYVVTHGIRAGVAEGPERDVGRQSRVQRPAVHRGIRQLGVIRRGGILISRACLRGLIRLLSGRLTRGQSTIAGQPVITTAGDQQEDAEQRPEHGRPPGLDHAQPSLRGLRRVV